MNDPFLLSLRSQVVRDLYWSLRAPHLLAPGYNSALSLFGLFEDSWSETVTEDDQIRAWLLNLDRNDYGAEITDWLLREEHHVRLGYYFSLLLEFWFSNAPRHFGGVMSRQFFVIKDSEASIVEPTETPCNDEYNGYTCSDLIMPRFVVNVGECRKSEAESGFSTTSLLHIESALHCSIAPPGGSEREALVSRFNGAFLYESLAWRLLGYRKSLINFLPESVRTRVAEEARRRLKMESCADLRSVLLLRGWVFRAIEDCKDYFCKRSESVPNTRNDSDIFSPPHVHPGPKLPLYFWTKDIADLWKFDDIPYWTILLHKRYWLSPCIAEKNNTATGNEDSDTTYTLHGDARIDLQRLVLVSRTRFIEHEVPHYMREQARNPVFVAGFQETVSADGRKIAVEAVRGVVLPSRWTFVDVSTVAESESKPEPAPSSICTLHSDSYGNQMFPSTDLQVCKSLGDLQNLLASRILKLSANQTLDEVLNVENCDILMRRAAEISQESSQRLWMPVGPSKELRYQSHTGSEQFDFDVLVASLLERLPQPRKLKDQKRKKEIDFKDFAEAITYLFATLEKTGVIPSEDLVVSLLHRKSELLAGHLELCHALLDGYWRWKLTQQRHKEWDRYLSTREKQFWRADMNGKDSWTEVFLKLIKQSFAGTLYHLAATGRRLEDEILPRLRETLQGEHGTSRGSDHKCHIGLLHSFVDVQNRIKECLLVSKTFIDLKLLVKACKYLLFTGSIGLHKNRKQAEAIVSILDLEKISSGIQNEKKLNGEASQIRNFEEVLTFVASVNRLYAEFCELMNDAEPADIDQLVPTDMIRNIKVQTVGVVELIEVLGIQLFVAAGKPRQVNSISMESALGLRVKLEGLKNDGHVVGRIGKRRESKRRDSSNQEKHEADGYERKTDSSNSGNLKERNSDTKKKAKKKKDMFADDAFPDAPIDYFVLPEDVEIDTDPVSSYVSEAAFLEDVERLCGVKLEGNVANNCQPRPLVHIGLDAEWSDQAGERRSKGNVSLVQVAIARKVWLFDFLREDHRQRFWAFILSRTLVERTQRDVFKGHGRFLTVAEKIHLKSIFSFAGSAKNSPREKSLIASKPVKLVFRLVGFGLKTDLDRILQTYHTMDKGFVDENSIPQRAADLQVEWEELQKYQRKLPSNIENADNATQTSYTKCLKSLQLTAWETAQVKLDKGQQRSDWLQRPLQKEQILYSAADPWILLAILAARGNEPLYDSNEHEATRNSQLVDLVRKDVVRRLVTNPTALASRLNVEGHNQWLRIAFEKGIKAESRRRGTGRTKNHMKFATEIQISS